MPILDLHPRISRTASPSGAATSTPTPSSVSRSSAPPTRSPSGSPDSASRCIATSARPGLVGRLRYGNSPRTIGLRADMDCLPIIEANQFVAIARKTPAGCTPAAKDGHTTMLLGAAKYLAEAKNFDGTVHFIFQPAEEGLGGAEAMVKDGLFDRFPCEMRPLRDAQPARGSRGRQIPDPRRRDDGGRRVLRHRDHRQGRARSATRRRGSIRSSSPRTSRPRFRPSSPATSAPSTPPSSASRRSTPAIARATVIPGKGGAARHGALLLQPDDEAGRRPHARPRRKHRRRVWRQVAELDFRALFPAPLNHADETDFIADCAAEVVKAPKTSAARAR